MALTDSQITRAGALSTVSYFNARKTPQAQFDAGQAGRAALRSARRQSRKQAQTLREPQPFRF